MSLIERVDQRAAYVASSPVLQNLEGRLQKHVTTLGGDIGARSHFVPSSLALAEEYIRAAWNEQGYRVATKEYTFDAKTYGLSGKISARNYEVEIQGKTRPEEIVLVGAHYDALEFVPGANDNASSVAALLEISQAFKEVTPDRTVRFVAFVNEEPPFFATPDMGSVVYARGAKLDRDNIVATVVLDELGYYSDEPESQTTTCRGRPVIEPTVGNFIAFVGNRASKDVVDRSATVFNASDQFPSATVIVDGPSMNIGGLNVYNEFPEAAASDHSAFWSYGYPALLVTDTAMFRYPYDHSYGDTPDKVDYPSLALVTNGLVNVIKDLSNAESINQ